MTYFSNFGTPLYLGTVAARNFNFGKQIDHEGHYGKNAKLGQNGSRGGHVTYF